MNKYLSIITLNVNVLNAPMKKHMVAEWLRKHILPKRDPTQNKDLQTESEGLEKRITSKQTGKRSQGSNIHI